MIDFPTKKLLQKMPKLNSIVGCLEMGLSEYPIGMHFYTDEKDWYLIEYGGWPRKFRGYVYSKIWPALSHIDTISLRQLKNGSSSFTWDKCWTPRRLFDIVHVGQLYGVAYRPERIKELLSK